MNPSRVLAPNWTSEQSALKARHEYLEEQVDHGGVHKDVLRSVVVGSITAVLLLWLCLLFGASEVFFIPYVRPELVICAFGLGVTLICGLIWTAHAMCLWHLPFARAIWAALLVSLLATSAGVYLEFFKPKSALEQWSKSFDAKASKCGDASARSSGWTETEFACVEAVLAKDPPLLDGPSSADKFYSSVLAGRTLLNNSLARQALREHLGIYSDSFIGSGFAIPSGEDYDNVRYREYLIPNFSETRPGVFAVRLEQTNEKLGSSIRGLLSASDARDGRGILLTDALTDRADMAYVRLGLVAQDERSGCVGRTNARHAMFYKYSELADATFKSALESAGLMRTTSNDAQDTIVWVYLDDLPKLAVHATWLGVFNLLRKDPALTQSSLCAATRLQVSDAR